MTDLKHDARCVYERREVPGITPTYISDWECHAECPIKKAQARLPL